MRRACGEYPARYHCLSTVARGGLRGLGSTQVHRLAEMRTVRGRLIGQRPWRVEIRKTSPEMQTTVPAGEHKLTMGDSRRLPDGVRTISVSASADRTGRCAVSASGAGTQAWLRTFGLVPRRYAEMDQDCALSLRDLWWEGPGGDCALARLVSRTLRSSPRTLTNRADLVFFSPSTIALTRASWAAGGLVAPGPLGRVCPDRPPRSRMGVGV